MKEDEMVGQYHQLDGQGSLARCSPWGHKDSNTTELLYLLILKFCSNSRILF